MREILFRGQTRKRGEKVIAGSGEKLPGIWVYGGIFPQSKGGSYSIIYTYDPIDKKIVYADTVGQYTGLTDKNGVKIFEGDILMHLHEDGHDFGVVRFGERSGATIEVGFYVEWVGENASVYRKDLGYWARVVDCEVCGSIHDNPELLREES